MPKFQPGDIVRKIYETSVTGRIIAPVEQLTLNQQYYVVDFGGRRIRIRSDELELAETTCSSPREQFLSLQFGNLKDTLRGLTFTRLTANLSNYIYSFNSSRTEFMPHQFKPLIKFLDSPARRILIADEVGLGKTIEAGIILLELQARHELQRALIVCPANLCDKWRYEMLERFELEFEILTGSEFVQAVQAVDSDYRQIFLITSYETLRSEPCQKAISQLTRAFSIVVADEAHRARNPNSKTHEALSLLSERAEALLLLSATPVNNRSEDLLTLLKLLDENVFGNEGLFSKQIAANRLILMVEKLLRLNPIDYSQILTLLDEFCRQADQVMQHHQSSFSLASNPYYQKLYEAIQNQALSSMDDKIRAQRYAAKLNLLSDYVNRTRRIEVQEYKPIREPNIAYVNYTPREQEIYQTIKALGEKFYPTIPLPVMTFERMASSCLPAFINRFRNVNHHQVPFSQTQPAPSIDAMLDGSAADVLGLSEENYHADTMSKDIQPANRSFQQELSRFLSSCDPLEFENIDSKFKKLYDTIQKILSVHPHAKIIIFSFFVDTLQYLSRRLAALKIGHVLVHGGISNHSLDVHGDSPRKKLYTQFRQDNSIRIMLSSEVGSEGLDFQFSNIVINYDLPWNPMVIEQRIGRVDRIGQASNKIHVYAYVIEQTIDELIYRYLLTKIGIFERCIGDLETIISSSIGHMASIAYQPELSEQQKREQLENRISAMLQKQKLIESLEEDAAKSGGLHDYIKDELQRIRMGGRWLNAEEMRDLIHSLMVREGIELVITNDPSIDGAYLGSNTSIAAAFFERAIKQERSREFMRFVHDLQKPPIRWTFEQHIAFKHPHIHLLNARHPAVRVLIKHFLEQHQRGAVFPSAGSFLIRLPLGRGDTNSVKPGCYLLGQYRVQFSGAIQRSEMLSFAVKLDPGDSRFLPSHEASLILGLITSHSFVISAIDPPAFKAEYWSTLIDQLDSFATKQIALRRQELETDRVDQLQKRRLQLMAQRDKKLHAIQARIDGLRKMQTDSAPQRGSGLIDYYTGEYRTTQQKYNQDIERLSKLSPIYHEEENVFLLYCEIQYD